MTNTDVPPTLNWKRNIANIAGMLIKTIINTVFLRIVLESFQVIVQNIGSTVCSLVRLHLLFLPVM